MSERQSIRRRVPRNALSGRLWGVRVVVFPTRGSRWGGRWAASKARARRQADGLRLNSPSLARTARSTWPWPWPEAACSYRPGPARCEQPINSFQACGAVAAAKRKALARPRPWPATFIPTPGGAKRCLTEPAAGGRALIRRRGTAAIRGHPGPSGATPRTALTLRTALCCTRPSPAD